MTLNVPYYCLFCNSLALELFLALPRFDLSVEVFIIYKTKRPERFGGFYLICIMLFYPFCQTISASDVVPSFQIAFQNIDVPHVLPLDLPAQAGDPPIRILIQGPSTLPFK